MSKTTPSIYYAGAAGLALALASLANPAMAQDAAAPAAVPATPAADTPAADAGSEIVVTGSRIDRTDLAASSPVSVISADTLKTVNTVTVEQILAVNPQFAAGLNGASNNPGDGSATLDLRGLGSKRTLVLVNGKRLPVYDATGSVDVNQIPTALIKNVQVLTGGASAVYGSDAISGVVNFVLDDKFTGLKFDGGAQVTGYGDGAQYDASLVGGFNIGDRGHLVLSANYSKREGVKYSARSFSNKTLCSDDLSETCGSSNTSPTAFDIPGASRQQVTASGGLTSDVAGYNYNPVNYAQTPFERWGGMALWNYDVSDHVELYGWGSYQHIKTVQTLAPTATAGYSFNIYSDNPYLSDAERTAFFDTTANPDLQINSDGSSTIGIRRRITETEGRVEQHTTTTWQALMGLRGDFFDTGFKFDTSVQYAQVHKHTLLENDLSYTKLTNAIDAVSDGNGGVQCRSASARAAGCVPIDVFSVNGITSDALSYVLENATQDDRTTQFVAEGNLSGDLKFLQSPFAVAPAALAVGATYRRETADTRVSDNYASGDLIYYGQGFNIPNKSYNVKEAYAEFKMPLVQDKPGIQALDIEAGYRYADYSIAGGVSAYKFGGDYAPVEGLRFRANFQRSVRAPNLYELYLPTTSGTGNLQTDPCAGANVAASIQTLCIAQGATQSELNKGSIPQPTAGQVNAYYGGNVDLKPEKSNTITVGMVVEPRRVPGLSLTLDYYDIKIANAITYTSATTVVSKCFASGDVNNAYCQMIHRSSIDGSLSGDTSVGVETLYDNVAVIRTRGLDFGLNFRRGRQSAFHYGFNFAGTYVIKNYSVIDGETYECAGKFGAQCDTPTPKWKHVASLNIGWKNLDLTTRWRLIGAVKEDEYTDIEKSHIPAYNYFDETANIRVNDKYTFSLGMLNVFNTKPPIVGDTSGATSVAGSTFATVYDVMGRTFFARVSANF
ncbi:TonB-dependent receptor [Novosphingobium sp. SG919]|uniref:TonB-dependent receptor domain-containing protein n=1 Tax=unclassified Novosphingobium TaxID=2644732 RepID=UPI00183FF59A|nr:outer membrane receptor protein involved in Fe transport [Novosphingobium sp. SG919]NMN87902.1 outer membrane receptor protein involved in Fe transport [Novosphingobium sp. SG916]